MTSFDWALEYRRLGWSIIPLRPQTKQPYSDALRAYSGHPGWKRMMITPPSPEEVEAWFQFDPCCGIGVVTGSLSGLVVIDFDRGEWPEVETPMVRTARGAHL